LTHPSSAVKPQTQGHSGREILRRKLIVVVVAVCIVLAGVSAWWYLSGGGRTTQSPPIRDDGPTLHQVLAAVNSSVNREGGGPWALFSVYGIAAQVPFSPNLIGYEHTNITVNSCGQAFNGLTLWNGTIPTFDGTFDSGTAPFWQLAYFSNASQQILIVTDVLGETRLYAPISYPGQCMPWYDLPQNTTQWTSPGAIPAIDSSEAAQVAWDAAPQGSSPVGAWVSANGPETEIITAGPGVFMGFGDTLSAYGIYFDRCGELGVVGVQPLVQAGVGSDGQLLGTSNLTHNCALIYSGEGAIDSQYDLSFAPVSFTNDSSTIWAVSGFQVGIALPNGSRVDFYDEVGLANWMTDWDLNSSSGSNLPLGSPMCQSWVSSLAGCPANFSGWYAVVLSATGLWVNSYGLTANGSAGWSAPVTALVSNQQLVVVCPLSWDLSGSKLTPTSTVSSSRVIGLVTL
jgi:hypothetical protein